MSATPEQVKHYEEMAREAVRVRHLTYSGQWAGYTLCGWGLSNRPADASYVHFTLAPDWMLTDDATCPVCQHVAACEDEACCVSHDGTWHA